MIGTGRATTDTISTVTGYRAKGVADGVSAGLYGTWFANAEDGAGLYVDGWMQYAKFNNRVISDELARVSYDSHGWSGSIEAGYAMRVYASDRSELFIQPQA